MCLCVTWALCLSLEGTNGRHSTSSRCVSLSGSNQMRGQRHESRAHSNSKKRDREEEQEEKGGGSEEDSVRMN